MSLKQRKKNDAVTNGKNCFTILNVVNIINNSQKNNNTSTVNNLENKQIYDFYLWNTYV